VQTFILVQSIAPIVIECRDVNGGVQDVVGGVRLQQGRMVGLNLVDILGQLELGEVFKVRV